MLLLLEVELEVFCMASHSEMPTTIKIDSMVKLGASMVFVTNSGNHRLGCCLGNNFWVLLSFSDTRGNKILSSNVLNEMF